MSIPQATLSLLPIAGTHANNGGQWWQPGSPFLAYMADHGIRFEGYEPFEWSCDLDGVFWELSRRHRDWRAGGKALRYYLGGAYLPVTPDVVMAHSHGLQVALYAASEGVQIPVLVSIMSPVREDMRRVAEAARPNISWWLHLYTPKDWTQRLGTWFDGKWGAGRQHPLADVNMPIHGVEHGSLVSDPRRFPLWDVYGIVPRIHKEVRRVEETTPLVG